ncbi:MAG: DNA translocase FtsK [Oscillospiraceae bacterium]|nr:DNA translocase FtsK [Oscillospiraceae bacterium]
MPITAIFGTLGAKIVIICAIALMAMLFTGFSIERFFNVFKSPFTDLKNTVKEIHEDAARKRYNREVKETSKYEIDSDDAEVIKLDTKKKPLKPVLDDSDVIKDEVSEKKESKFGKLKKMLGKKQIPKESEELADILKENQEKRKFESSSTDTMTIDIPISDGEVSVGKPVREKHPILKDNAPEEETGEKRRTIDLDKKSDYVNVPSDKSYNFPPIDFLREPSNNISSVNAKIEMNEIASKLVDTLESFGVKTTLIDKHRGPTVTRYELQPLPGVKISKITNLADDIALNLAAAGVRIEAPIPGKAAVGIEVPNAKKETVTLRELIESDDFQSSRSKLSFAVGRDIAGKIIIGDIAKMPHVIIAGSTGSGKSVCTNSIIMSILYKSTPEQVKLLLIDPKIVEFKVYDGIPHLLIPVVTDPRKAAGALNWAVQEMLRRYQLFADKNVRDLSGYNEMAAESNGAVEPMPQIVIAIDELADLMMAASNEVEDAICRLAQMARAAGMHLIIATQRPTVDIITGLIKANIPSRIALSVMSQTDSRTILDTGGAEKLLGQGDMLYFPSGIPKPIRVQGCFCSTKEIESVVNFIKQNAIADYSDEIIDEIEKNIPVPKGEKPVGKVENIADGDDELIEKAIDIIMELGQASTSSLQRKLKLGYARAARIMDELEQMGVIGPSEGSKPRKILMTKSQWAERRMRKLDDEEFDD